jgi:ribosome-binding factor A
MTSYHKERLSSLIQKELGEIIAKEIEFPLGSLTTISEVEISRDFKKAVVWVSVIPGEVSEEVLGILEKARAFQFGRRVLRLDLWQILSLE